MKYLIPENVKRIKTKSKETVVMSLRITKDLSEWLSKNDYRPSQIFLMACKELGYKNEFGSSSKSKTINYLTKVGKNLEKWQKESAK